MAVRRGAMIKPAPCGPEQPSENRGDGHFEHGPLPELDPPGMKRRFAIVGAVARAIIEARADRCVTTKAEFGEHRRGVGAKAIAPGALGGRLARSEQRRGGNGCGSPSRTRWSPDH